MSDQERLRITHDDAYNPKVDETLARQGSFGMAQRRPEPAIKAQGLAGFFYSGIFYLAVAGALGAALGWAIIEPGFNDSDIGPGGGGFFSSKTGEMLLWGIIGGLTGLFLGAADGLVSRQWNRALTGGAAGLGIGFGASAILCLFADIVFNLILMMVLKISDLSPGEPFSLKDLSLTSFIVLTLGRAMAWAPMGLAVGLGPAVAMRSRKLAFNGLIGGILGAFVGGLFFDPLCLIIPGEEAWVSRGCGFAAIGLGAGLMIGLVENLTKTAWLHIRAGSLAGKQFVIYRNPTVLGASPKCDVYLFKDEAIAARHAALHALGMRFDLEDLGSETGTFVNGQRISRQSLRNGDRIYLGETVLDFSVREET